MFPDTLCRRANLNGLIRLFCMTLGLRLAVLARNKHYQWHSHACCVLQVNICAITPVDALDDDDEFAVGKSHLELIDELLLRKRRIGEAKLREKTKGIARQSDKLLKRRSWLFFGFHECVVQPNLLVFVPS